MSNTARPKGHEQNETLGVVLMISFLGLWITIAIALQVIQVLSHGYGGGMGDGGHVPPEVRTQLGVPADFSPEQIMKATNK
jgi:hypothetical protein